MIEAEHEVRLHLLRRKEEKGREEDGGAIWGEKDRRVAKMNVAKREREERKVWNLADFLHERFYHTFIHKSHAIQNREENDISPVAKRFEKMKTAL